MGEDHGDGRDRQRLTVPEAATVLDMTVDAVRGRVRRGTIAHERDETGKVYVWVDATEADRLRPSAADGGPSRPPAQSELVEVLKAQLEAEREANRENRRIIAALTQRIPQLEAGTLRDERDARETVSETSEGTDTPTDRADRETASSRPRSWWRRLFGFE
jgi:hypothetical protein